MASWHRMDRDGPTLRLIAFTANDDGTRSVLDIVETVPHFAYHFAKSFMRNPDVASFDVHRVGSTCKTPASWRRTR